MRSGCYASLPATELFWCPPSSPFLVIPPLSLALPPPALPLPLLLPLSLPLPTPLPLFFPALFDFTCRCPVVQHHIHHHTQAQPVSGINKGSHVLKGRGCVGVCLGEAEGGGGRGGV